jgi:hypothetical protein
MAATATPESSCKAQSIQVPGLSLPPDPGGLTHGGHVSYTNEIGTMVTRARGDVNDRCAMRRSRPEGACESA